MKLATMLKFIPGTLTRIPKGTIEWGTPKETRWSSLAVASQKPRKYKALVLTSTQQSNSENCIHMLQGNLMQLKKFSMIINFTMLLLNYSGYRMLSNTVNLGSCLLWD